MADDVLLETQGSVATIRLNRPDAANALTLSMCNELLRVAIQCDEDPSVRAIVVTGAGKLFCAGGDLASFATMGDGIGAGLKEMTTYLHGAISRLTRGRAPVIMAVNGTAAGAGMSLAVAGDLAVASEDAKFTMAYTAAGLSPDGSSTWFLPRLIGVRRTQELMLTNRRLSAAEALDWGLVNRVVPAADVIPEAQKMAGELAEGPTGSFAVVKRLLAATFSESLETQMEHEAAGIAGCAGTPDGKEGIQAFLEKRKPSFSGS